MRKIAATLVVLLLGLVLSTDVWAGGPSPKDEVRIALSAEHARATGITLHSAFGDRVTADVTRAQIRALQARGIKYEIVPMRFIEAKPGKTTRSIPPTQVPYGIKMIYGDPTLTPAGISGGAGVTVAVLDTGSVNHPDFYRADGSRVITGCIDFSNRRDPLIEGSCADGHGHGTHVTGTIAAAGGTDGRGIFGVAPGANILSYKVLSDRGAGYADDIARAIRMAAENGANIISMSFGSSQPSPDEQAAIDYAVGLGVLVIAAAGNSGPAADTIAYPSAFAQVVAVAALNPDQVVAYFSSRGLTDGDDQVVSEREIEVAGPGRSVISTYKNGGYASMSGTSMATPHIAGLAAKGWQGSAAQTRSWLVGQAVQTDITQAEQLDNAAAGYDIASGYGLPQVIPHSEPLWSD